MGGADYVGAASGVHIRDLPLNQYVYAGASTTPVARTGYEYDNYTPDSAAGNRHAALVARVNISGLCAFYDAAGACLSPGDPSRPPASYTTRGNLTVTTRYLLDDAGAVTGSVTANQQYDVAGNVVKFIDPRTTPQLSFVTSVGYDDRFGTPDGEARSNSAPAELGGSVSYAFPTAVTNPLGQTIYGQFDYHTGRAVDGEDANGVVASGFYDDVLDRPTKLIAAANVAALSRETSFDYDDTNRVVTTKADLNTYQDGSLKSEVLYDGLGRTTETRQYESATAYVVTLTHYDGLGRVSESSNPYRPLTQPAETPVWTTTKYDPLGRVEEVKTPDGALVLSGYSGARVLMTDQAGKRRLSETDALGRLVKVWEITGQDGDTEPVTLPGNVQAYGYLTAYRYDVPGNLREVAQGGERRYFTYDSLSRLVRAKNPEQDAFGATAEFPALTDAVTQNGQWSAGYVYDAAGNLTGRIDARGVTTSYSYDGLGRVTGRSYAGEAGSGTPPVAYTYDDPQVAYSKGRLTKVSSSVSTYVYTSYDALGRVEASEQTTSGVTYTMGYGYDLAGNLTSEQYPSGRVVKTVYDRAGRVAGVKNQVTGLYYAGGDPAVANNPEVIGYTAAGAVSKVRLGNGLWEYTSFNSRLQPEQIGLGTSAGIDPAKLRLTYGYGPAGANNGNLRSQRIEGGGLDVTQGYEYDELNRLLWAEEKAGAASTWKQVYSYDRYGNRNFAAGTTYPDYTQSAADPVGNPVIDDATNRIKNTIVFQKYERVHLGSTVPRLDS